MSKLENLVYIPIALASPEKVREWSNGEITKAETINYKNHKPEYDGLFCQRIFGPARDYECGCGKFKRQRFAGIVCDECGVEVTKSFVRRERMGHIELAAPVAHFWFFRNENYLATILDIAPKKLEAVLYCNAYLVTEVVEGSEVPFQAFDLLTTNDYTDFKRKFFNDFQAGTGAEIIQELLMKIDLKALIKQLEEEIAVTKTLKRQDLMKRLRVVDAFHRSKNRPEWMVIEALPVIPPDMRPMVQLDGGRFATADLNDLYRRIITRNSRLKRLKDVGAPEIIVNNEKRMLQDAVDSLIANHKRKHPMVGSGKRALKSLSDSLEGKQGLFRQNLLGKRVDYSGRSVITVGPEMRIDECGLPRKMAIELFKPFVMRELIRQGYCEGTEAAKKRIERQSDEIWDILEQVVDHHPVLLNRAPTLHKLSIRSFYPKIVEGEAIRLHPLVTPGFNADFDGDQMAVHIPLSHEAQTEARVLMLASENLLHPQNGESAITPSQDMILGTYYISLEKDGEKGEGKAFLSEEEAIYAYNFKKISLHAKIILYIQNHDKFTKGKYLVTTVGKILFNQKMPESLVYINNGEIKEQPDGVFDTITEAIEYIPKKQGKPFDKGFLKRLIGYSFDKAGSKETAIMADGMKDIGFKYATKGGLTISLFDITVPETKAGYLKQTEDVVQEIEMLFRRGRLTEEERYEMIVKEWGQTSKIVASETMKELRKHEMNPIRMMIDSGARGSEGQFRQLAGMRGLMANPHGKTIERPIKASFSEGLSVLEFFISTHGARKGMADTSLKTADSGYLTRRLVDVAQNVVITEPDCGTEKYYTVTEITQKEGNLSVNLHDRIVGRFTGKDVHDKDGNLLASHNTYITEDLAKVLTKHVKEVPIRNLFICESPMGACQKCYGQNLSTRKVVDIGEPIGVVAAQSIGEPGTQLTMRTFHSGGVAGNDITQGLPRVQEIFEARKLDTKKSKKAVLSEVAGTVEVLSKGSLKDVVIKTEEGEEVTYHVNYGFRVLVETGQKVEKGHQLTDGSINPHEMVKLRNLKETQEYLLAEVHRVYSTQGVAISDKHIETIVRQMTRKVTVKDPGDYNVVIGSLVDRYKTDIKNKELKAAGKKEIEYKDKVLGITQAALATESYLSAASFQETSKVLSEAAIMGKKDKIQGLKEAVIVGKRIPAGTGSPFYHKEK